MQNLQFGVRICSIEAANNILCHYKNTLLMKFIQEHLLSDKGIHMLVQPSSKEKQQLPGVVFWLFYI